MKELETIVDELEKVKQTQTPQLKNIQKQRNYLQNEKKTK